MLHRAALCQIVLRCVRHTQPWLLTSHMRCALRQAAQAMRVAHATCAAGRRALCEPEVAAARFAYPRRVALCAARGIEIAGGGRHQAMERWRRLQRP